MAKTQRRRKMSRRRNKSRSLKGGTKASSKSHIAAAAPASSLAIHKRPDESPTDFLERLKKQIAYIASLKKPAGVKKPEKTLTPHEMALIKMQQKINARNAEVRSASRARPKHGDSSYAEYSRAAAAARGTGNPQ
jgi:hypothetical protein